MWTDLGFNLILLLASDYFAVLMISNVCYFIFNFLNLQSGWIHRIDRPNRERPFRCPNWLLYFGAVLGFVNLAFMGAGADVWGEGTLRNGLLATAIIVPVFLYRHYWQDRGTFPTVSGTAEDVAESGRKAGVLPFVTLGLSLITVWLAHHFSILS